MRNVANLTIRACCLIALMIGSGVSCKKKARPDSTVAAVPAPNNPVAPPPVPKAAPPPVAASAPPVAVSETAAGKDVDAGVAGQAELKPAPFYLLPPRPDCKMPPRVLMDEDGRDGLELLTSGNSWAFIRPQNLPVKDEKAPGEMVVLPSYFAGLPPGEALVVIFKDIDPGQSHPAESSSPEYRSVKPVWVGPFSDHCLAVRPNDRSLLFSILLADDLALQAVVHRSKKRQRVSENEVDSDYYFNPVLAFELRTVDLKTGKVRDRKLHAADPEAVLHDPIQGVWPKVKFLGETGVAVYPFGFEPPLLFLVKRSGEIPTMHKLKSDTIGFGLRPIPQPPGGWRFRYHEKGLGRRYEADPYELSLDITPELTVGD